MIKYIKACERPVPNSVCVQRPRAANALCSKLDILPDFLIGIIIKLNNKQAREIEQESRTDMQILGTESIFVAETKQNNIVYTWSTVCTVQLMKTWR